MAHQGFNMAFSQDMEDIDLVASSQDMADKPNQGMVDIMGQVSNPYYQVVLNILNQDTKDKEDKPTIHQVLYKAKVNQAFNLDKVQATTSYCLTL